MNTEQDFDFTILACPADPLDMHLHATKIGDPNLLRVAFVTGGRFVGTDDEEVWTIEHLVKLLESDGEGWEMRLIAERKFICVSDEAWTFFEFLEHATYGRMRASGVVTGAQIGTGAFSTTC